MPVPDLALLVEAAEAAGQVALGYWRRTPRVWDKPGDAGPVTEADIAVNDLLAARLRGARPDYGWLSEETPDTPARLGAQRCFIIDPIDGTRAFIAGEESFAHSLAVAEAGQIIAAVVHLPAKGLTYAASLGQPAVLNGAPLAASPVTDPAAATILAARSAFEADHWHGAVPPLRRAFRPSIAYRLCLVAEGRFDAMMTLRPTWEWDIAAGDLIARQSGALVTDRHGEALRFNAPHPTARGVLAAGAGLHPVLMAKLRLPGGGERG